MQVKMFFKDKLIESMSFHFPDTYTDQQKGAHLKKLIDALLLKHSSGRRKTAAKPTFLIDGIPANKSAYTISLE
ncbi:MAG: hypothetical protein M3342_19255 [Bacteroidota bacterium]|nr:hypothetical protein [Flavisolibacter sp.]MBD0351360.1 hypothetical protein [Flavisolibacter sp.]MBD0365143.1 hypothetical protein [Flavisolibacter sp.]MBD0375797.1 hypothetical protein [Flavisolibacter sp.]MDQ3846120.1 hypothetical protein [Bacteroidota bacterium]